MPDLSERDHTLTWSIGGWLTALDVAAGKTCACVECGATFFDMVDANAVPCGGGTTR